MPTRENSLLFQLLLMNLNWIATVASKKMIENVWERNLKERKETMMRTNVGFSHTLSITYYIRLCTLQIKLGIACCKKNLKKFLLNLSKSSLEPLNNTGQTKSAWAVSCLKKKGLAVISNDVGGHSNLFMIKVVSFRIFLLSLFH